MHRDVAEGTREGQNFPGRGGFDMIDACGFDGKASIAVQFGIVHRNVVCVINHIN